MTKIKRILLPLLLILLVYTRFVNIRWGLPYSFHPDERNMAAAIQQLFCKEATLECFNPHFFAYGQLPLYLGYFLIKIDHFLLGGFGRLGGLVTYVEAVVALRIISAVASIVTVFLSLNIIYLLDNLRSKTQDLRLKLIVLLLFIFSPGLIQFAHFGTTESLLIMFFTGVIYLSLLFLSKSANLKNFILKSGIICGLAIGTKVSAGIFIFIPLLVILFEIRRLSMKKIVKAGGAFIVCTMLFYFISSPYNFLSSREFLSTLRYESSVAFGSAAVFYTRQFLDTVPVLFQFLYIFPYALGPIALVLFLFSFLLLPFNSKYNLLRLSFFIYFLFNAFLFTKWTRFMAPLFPLMLIFAVMMLISLKIRLNHVLYNLLLIVFSLLMIVPGLAYISIYTNQDVRIQASKWIHSNVPIRSTILSEIGNVVDIPLPLPNYQFPISNFQTIPFNFYDLDKNDELKNQLNSYLLTIEYIIVPSRRIFMDHSKERYPFVNNYYKKLFSGELGFKKIAEFSSYPKIELFGKKLIEFKDEKAEETWSVFDHPVIRVYKKI